MRIIVSLEEWLCLPGNPQKIHIVLVILLINIVGYLKSNFRDHSLNNNINILLLGSAFINGNASRRMRQFIAIIVTIIINNLLIRLWTFIWRSNLSFFWILFQLFTCLLT